MLSLFPPQERCVSSLLSSLTRHGAALNSSITGSGKSIMSVELARRFNRPVFVIAPKITLPSWRDLFAEQGVPLIAAINFEALRFGNTQWVERKARKVLSWNLPKGALLIVDECHKALNRGTLNGKLVVAARAQGHPVLLLSATAGSDPSEFSVIGEVLGLHTGKDYVRWAMRWGCTMDPWRNLCFKKSASHKLDELNRVIYPDLGYKLTRDDMGEFFTQTSIVTEPIDFGDLQAVYDEMEQEIATITAKEGEFADVLVAELRARQKCEILKVPTLVEMVEDELENKRSVVVFFSFRDSMAAFMERAKFPVGQIHGGIKDAERQQIIKDFASDKLRVVACQVCAGGVGINLHDTRGEYPRTALVCCSYEEKVIVQALGRVDRAGAKSDTVQRILFAKGTIEEKVEKSMRGKLKNLFRLHDFSLAPGEAPAIITNMSETIPEYPTIVTPLDLPAHHPRGPSKWKDWARCAGFTNREGEVHERTLLGSRVHLALETDDCTGLLTDEEHDLYYQSLSARDMLLGGVTNFLRETRLTLTCDGEQIFGTADVLHVNGDTATLIDYKMGRHKVDPADKNLQGVAYSLAVFEMYPAVESVMVAFIQVPCDYVTAHTFSRGDVPNMLALAENIMSRRKKAECSPDDVSLLAPNDKCGWCQRAIDGTCKALSLLAVEVAKSYAAPEVVIPEVTHGSMTDDPETIAANYKLAKILEPWIDGAKERAKRLYWEEGHDLPGFTPVERKGRRSVDASVAWHVFQEILPGASVEEFIALFNDMSFKDLADLAKERAPKGKKSQVVSSLESQLRSMDAIKDGSATRFFVTAKDQ